MTSTYDLDESGTSGDLANTAAPDFGGQPIFALACVGIDDLEDVGREIARLKKDYRVQGAELKSVYLVKKPGFIRDLTGYLKRRHLDVLLQFKQKGYAAPRTVG